MSRAGEVEKILEVPWKLAAKPGAFEHLLAIGSERREHFIPTSI